MQRKYIYIIVFWLTIFLVATEQYFDFKKNSSQNESAASEKLDELNKDIQKNIELNSSLIIKNTQKDDRKLSYIYKIKIDGVNGAKKTSINGKEKYIVFTANGEAQVILNSNESIIIYELPEEKYTIEQINEINDLYTTKVNNKETMVVTGTITTETNVVFENVLKIKETPKEEIKEEIKEEVKEEYKNPLTVDFITIIFIATFISFIILALLSRMKIKRFE